MFATSLRQVLRNKPLNMGSFPSLSHAEILENCPPLSRKAIRWLLPVQPISLGMLCSSSGREKWHATQSREEKTGPIRGTGMRWLSPV